MKIGWLVWYDQDSRDAGDNPTFWTTQPEEWRCSLQIVYAEII